MQTTIPHTANAVTFTATNKLGPNENLTLTQKKITELIGNTQLTSADVDVLEQKIAVLQSKIDSLTKTNVVEESVSADTNLNQPDADLVLTAGEKPVETPMQVTAKSVEMKEVEITNTYASLKATGDVTLDSVVTSGILPQKSESTPNGSNAQISINTDEFVEISDSNFGQTSYNGIEVGLTKTAPKNVLINNCTFKKNTHAAINVFAFQDNTTITVSNCTFDAINSLLRITNRDNKKATFNFVNCTIKKHIEEADPYNCFIFCQDHISKDEAEAKSTNMFAPEKIKINFINCTGPNGAKFDYGPNPSSYAGTGDSNQLIYVYRNKGGFVKYDKSAYPEITFK